MRDLSHMIENRAIIKDKNVITRYLITFNGFISLACLYKSGNK